MPTTQTKNLNLFLDSFWLQDKTTETCQDKILNSCRIQGENSSPCREMFQPGAVQDFKRIQCCWDSLFCAVPTRMPLSRYRIKAYRLTEKRDRAG